MTEWQSQVTLAMIVPYALQWLKGQNWFPLVNYTNDFLNRMVAVVIAAAAGFGIAFNFDGDTGILTITGLTLAGLWSGTLHAVQQFFMQHTIYKLAIAPPKPGLEQAISRDVEAGHQVTKPE